MAFTKINAAGIGSTETVTLDGLSVINNGSFGGNLTVGGVLTYEDVTNVDSVGLITARNGIVVGSGITLSKDGDGFFTGVVTATSYAGDGSGLTGIAATDNVRTGILDVAGVGTFRNDVNIPDKIIHLGDTDTAIRFPAADTFTVETAGAERLRVKSDGSILHTAASGSTILTLKRSNTNVSGATGTINFAASDDHSVASIMALGDGDNEGANLSFRTTTAAASDDPYDSSIVERLLITSDGKIGINQTPTRELSVHSPNNNNALIHFTNDDTGETASDGIVIGLNGNEDMIVNNQESSKNIIIYNGGTEYLRLTSAGNFGIGSDDPQALTHIYDDTDTSSATEQFRISGGDRSADAYETGFRFFTQSPSTNGNRHYRFTANGNTGLIIQGHETSSGNAAVDRKILLNPDGGDVGVGTDRTGAQAWRAGRTLEIGAAGGNSVAQLFLTSNRGDGEQTAGSIVFADNTQGSSQHNLAIIECDKKGSTANNRGGSLPFATKSDGSTSPDNAWQMTAGGTYGGSTTDYSTLRHMKGVTSYSSAYNSGDIYIHIDGLYNLPGNAWWYTQVLFQSTEIVGTQAGSHHYLTSLTLMGIAQWNSVGVNNVVGSASVSISASTSTSVTLFVNVNDSSRGPITVWASNTVGQDGPYISFS